MYPSLCLPFLVAAGFFLTPARFAIVFLAAAGFFLAAALVGIIFAAALGRAERVHAKSLRIGAQTLRLPTAITVDVCVIYI